MYKDFLEEKALTPSIEHVSINLKDVIKYICLKYKFNKFIYLYTNNLKEI